MNEGNPFSTLVYQKKTSTGLFTVFNSFTPISYKIGLVRCFIDRAFEIISSYIIFHKELENIKVLLQNNIFPKSVIDNKIEIFLEKQLTVDSVTTSEKCKILHYSFGNNFVKALILTLHLCSFFSCKDTLHNFLQSYAHYQFTCQDVKPVILMRLSVTWNPRSRSI